MEEARSREIKALLSQTKAALAQGDPRVALMNLTQVLFPLSSVICIHR